MESGINLGLLMNFNVKEKWLNLFFYRLTG